MNIKQLLEQAQQRSQAIAIEIAAIDTTQEGAEARMDALIAEHASVIEARDRYQAALGITASTPVQTVVTPNIAQINGADDQRSNNPRGTLEYRQAFMNYVLRGQRSELLERRADEQTLTEDATAVIPSNLQDRIISTLETYGGTYARITKTNLKGGVSYPISTFNPEAQWVAEGEVSETKKAEAKDSITFNYYLLEARVAMGIIASVTTLESFEKLIVEKMVAAMIKAIEKSVFVGTGTGQPAGVLGESRIPAAQKLSVAAADLDYKGWIKILGKLPSAYRANASNAWYMAQATFDEYVAGLVDDKGQPAARPSYDITGKLVYRLLGFDIEIVPETYIKSFTAAAASDPVFLFGNLAEWGLNSNMVITYEKYRDKNTNRIIDVTQAIADGKTLDANAFLVGKKKTA